jgi:hypothetical protein
MAPARRKRKWSAEVIAHSDALDLEPLVLTKPPAEEIAQSVKRSAEISDRRSAMSMLNLYINRAGRNLPPRRKKVLKASQGQVARAVRPQGLTASVGAHGETEGL